MTKSIPYPATHPRREYPPPPARGFRVQFPAVTSRSKGESQQQTQPRETSDLTAVSTLSPPPPPQKNPIPLNKDCTFWFHFSYLGTTLRQANIEPMPSISDVRRVITEFAILPLGNCSFVFIILT